jgi:hypothetical protein
MTPMAHAKLEQVRNRYKRCCGYCGVSEAESGGELTIDHFHPVSAGGDEHDDNLVYACFRCNTYKADFWPNDDDMSHGRRILHPLLDTLGLHIRENRETGRLEAVTPTGDFHIFQLRLNRPQLIVSPLIRRVRQLLSEDQLLLESENVVLRIRVKLLEDYLHELTRRRTEEAGEEL